MPENERNKELTGKRNILSSSLLPQIAEPFRETPGYIALPSWNLGTLRLLRCPEVQAQDFENLVELVEVSGILVEV